MMSDHLPIDDVLADVKSALNEAGAVVLVAAPGAGKSTRVGPALMDDTDGNVLLLQPRRMAARSIAARIADEMDEQLGGRVGYHVRRDKKGTADTTLWVLTEGILTRRLKDDPYLEGVSTVILDEFHERSLQVDIALAWVAELRRTLRPDLRLVVMSATIDPQPVSSFLGDCPVVQAAGRQFPISLQYASAAPRTPLVRQVADGVRRALAEVADGDVLAFLPGVGEINGCANELTDVDADIIPLHGSLPADEQDRALYAGPRRRIILSTNVAETSLTIEGVTAVVDGGMHRVMRFDPERGLPVLRLERISQWNAEQRAGRSGRASAGWCLRCWSRLDQQRLSESPAAEIADTDLTPLCLELRRIHGDDLRNFPWYQAPEPEHLKAAEDLLALLEIIEAPYGPLSGKGKYLGSMPVHPRLACLLLAAERCNVLSLGAAVAALLSEREIRQREAPRGNTARYADIENDLALLDKGPRHPDVHSGAWRQVDLLRKDLLRHWGQQTTANYHFVPEEMDRLPDLLLAAYPDRVAKRPSTGANRVQWQGGAGALAEHSLFHVKPGQKSEQLCVAYAVRGSGGHGRKSTTVDGVAEITLELLEATYPQAFSYEVECSWNAAKEKIEGAKVLRFGQLVLRYEPGVPVPDEVAQDFFTSHLNEQFAQQLARFDEAYSLWQRLEWLARYAPDLLLVELAELKTQIIASWIPGHQRLSDLPNPCSLIEGLLGWDHLSRLNELVPSHITLPAGRRAAVRYEIDSKFPVLALRIQECFGWKDGPVILNGQRPLRLHLQAPNGRPQQITDNLAGFWAGSYAQVRKDLRGRYPKHPWPEDPANEPPIKRRPPHKRR